MSSGNKGGVAASQQTYRMRILALLDYFEPGYKAGGPIRTLGNMIARLGDEFEFRVITRDRDLGSAEPYPSIAVNEWSRVGKAEVFYASPVKHLPVLLRLLRWNSCDVLYLNSFFSWKSAIVPLVLLRWGLVKDVPVVLAPRGEFSAGALELKAAKKRVYIALARMFGLCRRVIWQASSEAEAADIRRVMQCGTEQIVVAPNLLPVATEEPGECKQESPRRQPGPLRIIFLSRISPMKNLHFLLSALKSVSATVSLDVYGPIEDSSYWDICSRLIDELQPNISVNYRGAVPADQVAKVFRQYDLFAFPTRGENFGHVIFESLNAGTPVLLSDRTPWRADTGGAIEILALDNEDAWTQAISRWAEEAERGVSCRYSRSARAYARAVCANDQALKMNRQLFSYATGRHV